jgi:hypothetical protein
LESNIGRDPSQVTSAELGEIREMRDTIREMRDTIRRDMRDRRLRTV